MTGEVVPVLVVEDDPAGEARRMLPGRIPLDGPPAAEPYELAGEYLVWPVVVRDEAGAQEVVEAVARGVAVVVELEVPEPVAERLIDDLARASLRGGAAPDPRPRRLTDDQRQLLAALGEGLSLAAAARSVGLSARSASRRVAEARFALGVRTTAEAVVRAHVLDGLGEPQARSR